MFKQWLLVIGLLVPLLGCGHLHHSTRVAYSQDKSESSLYTYFSRGLPRTQSNEEYNQFKLSDFNRLVITGAINVRIHTGARRAWITLHGDKRDRDMVIWSVKHNTMYIHFTKKAKGAPKYGPVDIDIGMRHWVALNYDGRGSIVGHRLSAKQLDLTITNQGETILDGQVNLHRAVLGGAGTVRINTGRNRALELILKDKVRAQLIGVSELRTLRMSDYSRLSAYWIRTHTLHISLQDFACAQIAGVARLELIDLRGHARLNARYLRATEAFVKTHNVAVADIAVVSKQHTLAEDKSNIYYYNLPTYSTDFMAMDGSVLDLRTWDMF